MGKRSADGKKAGLSTNTSSLQKTILSSKTILFSWKLGGITGEGVSKIPTATGEFYTHTTFSKPVRLEGTKLPRSYSGQVPMEIGVTSLRSPS